MQPLKLEPPIRIKCHSTLTDNESQPMLGLRVTRAHPAPCHPEATSPGPTSAFSLLPFLTIFFDKQDDDARGRFSNFMPT